ncbi:hypothetical protein J2S00_003305 [Caldalkalibacillus uzonensis]|uniref:DUF2642 domain-containing protein n=1 Tax=Caldalkalibacillus uzonensis TaxID=353224 RepID=A0ABU0CVS7_9BACI|nr:DUF2642 domain-containing protein [Caldalkalibacillus uzonensis]MDQ0340490.1 hypothetical protein [Caldalkalibacillus uzonensis]
MKTLNSYVGKIVDLEVSGKLFYTGFLVDVGDDIIVLNTGEKFLYLPFIHIHNIKLSKTEESEIEDSTASSAHIDTEADEVTYRKLLENARELFLEIYITENHTIHGYLINIMDDYFVFYSPVYHTMFISLDHLKYFTPYNPGLTPYSVGIEHFPVKPFNGSLAHNFEQQLKLLEGKFILLDLGQNPNKIGFFKKLECNTIQLTTANRETFHWNIRHIKTVHLP